MTTWNILWAGWGVYFLIVEGWALYLNTTQNKEESKTKRTLSAHGWAIFGTAPGTEPDLWAWIRRAVLLLFILWFGVHFLSGGQIV